MNVNQDAMINQWVAMPESNPQARVRVFCLPYAGGGATAYYSWMGRLPKNIELCRILIPGRETRFNDPPYSDLQILVEAIVEALLPLFDIPFAIFGHSMGSFIGFELARKLRKLHNIEPVHLFVSARRAPQIPDPEPPTSQLSDVDFIDHVGKFNGTPEAVIQSQELMELFLPVLRADFSILETYRYRKEPPLDCPITAFGGLSDHKYHRWEIEAWREQTSNRFKSFFFSGRPFFHSR